MQKTSRMPDKEIIKIGGKVEISSDEPGFEGSWHVGTVVDIVGDTPINNNSKKRKKTNKKTNNKNTQKTEKYVVKYEHEDLCVTTEPRFVRPIPPKVLVEADEFEEGDVINAYQRDGWWTGCIEKVNNIDGYLVRFNQVDKVWCKKDQLRFHVDWVDSCWKHPLKNKKEGSGSQSMHQDFTIVQQEVITAEASEAEDGLSQQRTKKGKPLLLEERSGSQPMHQDFPIVEQEVNTAGASEAEDCLSQQRTKKGKPLLFEERSGSQSMHQEFSIVEQEVITTEASEAEDGQSQQGTQNGKPVLFDQNSKTGDGQMINSPNGLQEGSPAVISNAGINNEQQVWPFVKQSPHWATFESMEVFQKQKPHFSPLKKMGEHGRERRALGKMMEFESLNQDVFNYQPSDPIEMIHSCLEHADELEHYGFDVSSIRCRLNSFLSWKTREEKLKDELKKSEDKIKICNAEIRTAEGKSNELEVKFQALKDEMQLNTQLKTRKEQELKMLWSVVESIANKITEKDVAITKLAAMPLY